MSDYPHRYRRTGTGPWWACRCGALLGVTGQVREDEIVRGSTCSAAMRDEIERLELNATLREGVMRRQLDLLRAVERERDEARTEIGRLVGALAGITAALGLELDPEAVEGLGALVALLRESLTRAVNAEARMSAKLAEAKQERDNARDESSRRGQALERERCANWTRATAAAWDDGTDTGEVLRTAFGDLIGTILRGEPYPSGGKS